MAKEGPPYRQNQPYYGKSEFGQYDYNLGRKGYQGLNENLDKVNTMDAQTQADINSRLGSIYNRANQDFGINYNDQIAKQLAGQYGKMGTLSSTSGLYANDMANRTAQRKLADLAYNQAENYQSDVDRELQRRYNALNEYQKMFGIGQDVSQQDYKTGLKNQDINYQNDYNNWATGQANTSNTINTIGTLAQLALMFGGLNFGGGTGSSSGGVDDFLQGGTNSLQGVDSGTTRGFM